MMNFRKFANLTLLSIYLFSPSRFFSQGAGLTIELFSPTAQSKQVKQVQVRFTEAMVSLGDPRPKIDLFKIDCPILGKARWIDSSTWVYEYEQELPGGVICVFTASASIRSLRGNSLIGQKEFSFHTGGPSIQYSSPYASNMVDEDQIFILTLDAKPDLSSIEKFAYFSITELGNKIPIEIISGKERQLILKSQGMSESEKIVIIRSKQIFLPEKNIQLIWGKGIRAEYGGVVGEDEILNFSVRPPFSVSFSCERVNAKADCIPILPLRLYFSSSVPHRDLKKVTLKSKSGKEYPSQLQAGSLEGDSSHYLSFSGPFPENSEFLIQIPKPLKDDMGRELINPGNFPLLVKTAEFPPLAKFPAKFGILEANGNPALPVTLRNLEAQLPLKKFDLTVTANAQKTIDPLEIQKWFSALSKQEREKSIFAGKIMNPSPVLQMLPKPNGKKPMEVVGIPLEKPGFYIVELASDILGSSLLEKKGKMYVASSALVTNLAVHFKWGNDSSLVWVTSLDQAIPEAGVMVKIVDCKGNVRATGITGKEGTLKLRKLGTSEIPYCGYYELGSGLTVFAQKGEDISFTSTNWDQGIETWRFNLPSYSFNGSSEIQAIVLDRTLFRAGETVHLKHYRRGHNIQGVIAADTRRYPKKLMIQHDGSGEKFSFPLVWSFPGTTESEFKIPKNARLGTYQVYYPATDDDDSYGNTVVTFKVEEFRLPILRGGIQLADSKVELIAPKKARVELNLQYLSGGGAASFPIGIRGQITPRFWSPTDDYSAFSFNPEKIEAEKIHLSNYSEEETGDPSATTTNKVFTTEKITLDEKGFGSFTFENLKAVDTDSALEVEMEYVDPSGEIQTTYRSFPIYQSNLHLGILPKGWMFSKEKIEMQILVLDLKNQPKKNQNITVKAFSISYFSNRKRLVGGYYAYEHYKEVKELGIYCQGKTNDKGLLFCENKAPASGEIIFSAEAEDGDGHKTNSVYSAYVASSEDSWFEATDHNRMDILPEKKFVEIGETLKIQLRSPFREATALITVEREGVIDSFVIPVNGKEPVVTIPIKKEYAPNVFIGALILRGRIGDPKPTALIDLGRPSFRLGLAPIRVGWKPYELSVFVKTNQSKFKVREKVSASVEVRDYLGKIPKAGGEVLIAVVDEALLELSPNPTWRLLESMMGLRGLDVSTSTAQSQVIGRRHFGLKAKPTGGGGGKSPTRSIFNTLVYWQGKLTLDKEGKANFVFPLNDSLTSFKVVAVASSGTHEFGTGSISIQTSQDIQSFAGIPNVVRDGDLIDHEFTIRNSTSESRKLSISLSVEDHRKNSSEKSIPVSLETKAVDILASATSSLYWELLVPSQIQGRTFRLEVKDEKGNIIDRLLSEQKVIPVLKESVYMAGLQQLDGKFSEKVKAPEDSLPGESHFKVSVSPSILTNLKSVDSYFLSYPYACMEQRVSTAIGLRSNDHWRLIDGELGGYLDNYGLVKYFPKMDHGSEILTAYLLTSSKLAGFTLNGDSTTKMIEGLKGYLSGNVKGDPWSFGADLMLRRIIVIEAVSRYETLEWDFIGSILNNIELLPTSSLIDLSEIISRMNGVDLKIKNRVSSALRSRLNLQGTELVIADKNFPTPWWILGSNDYTMAKFTLWAFQDESYRKDLPRIVKGLLKKQSAGRWDTTLGNAYGVLAVDRVGKVLETEPVQGGVVKISGLGKEILLDPNLSEKKSTSIPIGKIESEINITYDGKGKPWMAWEARSKIPLKNRLNSGYALKRFITPILKQKDGLWTKGDIIKVRLEIVADSDKTWVVVEDAVPSGSIHLGRGLGKESKILAGSISQEVSISATFEERSFSHYRAYFEYLPQGKHKIEYTIQLNHPGKFVLPGARVEAMYSPETFGELPAETMQISGERI